MTLLFVGLMRLLSHMPLRGIRVLGHFLGCLLWVKMKNRKHIVQTNLRLCFPEKPIEEIKQFQHRFAWLSQFFQKTNWGRFLVKDAPILLVFQVGYNRD